MFDFVEFALVVPVQVVPLLNAAIQLLGSDLQSLLQPSDFQNKLLLVDVHLLGLFSELLVLQRVSISQLFDFNLLGSFHLVKSVLQAFQVFKDVPDFIFQLSLLEIKLMDVAFDFLVLLVDQLLQLVDFRFQELDLGDKLVHMFLMSLLGPFQRNLQVIDFNILVSFQLKVSLPKFLNFSP